MKRDHEESAHTSNALVAQAAVEGMQWVDSMAGVMMLKR